MNEDWNRFFQLRKKIFEKIRKVDQGYHKSYEGAVDVTFSFNNIYESEDVQDTDLVVIELHCYLLINGRHKKWEGHTFAEALDKMENDINWLMNHDSI